MPSIQQFKESDELLAKALLTVAWKRHTNFARARDGASHPKVTRMAQRNQNPTGSFVDIRVLDWWQGRESVGRYGQGISLTASALVPGDLVLPGPLQGRRAWLPSSCATHGAWQWGCWDCAAGSVPGVNRHQLART